MEIKKFTSIKQLLMSKEFQKKDLSYCDLSGIDLSTLPTSTWKEFKFNHTDFTNTGVKFYPEQLASKYIEYRNVNFYYIEYCNFTNCDLSYLTTSDFAFCSIKGCNFTNTGLNVDLINGFGRNIKCYWKKDDYKDYSDITFPQNSKINTSILKICAVQGNKKTLIDYNTVQKNPTIPFSSITIYLTIKKEIPSIDKAISSRNMKELNCFIDKMLKEDEKREGNLVKFFNILDYNNPFTEFERIHFFQGYINNKKYGVLDLSTIPNTLINMINFCECDFEKIIFPKDFEKKCSALNIKTSKTSHVYFPTITPSSWQLFNKNRLGNSRITIYRNLYLELGRFCNGKCKFCRNQYLEPCTYDLSSIINNLSLIGKYIDNIVIGGGEPTLKLNDIEKILSEVVFNNEYTIFTNASLSLQELINLSKKVNLNISRHSVFDSTNNQILGVNSLSFNELKELQDNAYGNITLCPTCFKKDGLDTVEKIEEYIEFARECSISNVLFQTLHKDLNSSNLLENILPIDDEIFDEMIIKLSERGYKISMPIYSTGDYKLIVAKKNEQTISFKKYITKEELENEWYQACKRTFDLSMDPSGNLYENWHQSSGKAIVKKFNNF